MGSGPISIEPSHWQRAPSILIAGRFSINTLDLAVGLTGAAGVFGLFALPPWWHSSSDFRLPVLLIAATGSILGGVVAAYTFERLRARAERDRWRYVAHVAATALVGRALGVGQSVATTLADMGVEVPRTVDSLQALNEVEAAFREHQQTLLLHVGLATVFGNFAVRAWDITRTTPGLRDDHELLRELFQGADSLPSWPATIRNVEQGGQVTPRQAQNLSIFRDVAWQTLRVCYERGLLHQDAELDAQTLDDYKTRREQADAAVADATIEAGAEKMAD